MRRATEAKRSSAVSGAARETGEGVIAARPVGVTPTALNGEALVCCLSDGGGVPFFYRHAPDSKKQHIF